MNFSTTLSSFNAVAAADSYFISLEKEATRHEEDDDQEYSLHCDNSLYSSSNHSESSLSNSEADLLIYNQHTIKQTISIIDSSNQLSDCFGQFLEPLSLISPNNTFLKVSENELLEEFPNVNTVNSIFAETAAEESNNCFLYRPQDLELFVNTLESDNFNEKVIIKSNNIKSIPQTQYNETIHFNSFRIN